MTKALSFRRPFWTITALAVVAAGDADIAVQPVSELLHTAGIDFVGPLPAEVQLVQVFAAGVVAESQELEAANRRIAFFASESASAAIEKSGIEPLGKVRPDGLASGRRSPRHAPRDVRRKTALGSAE